MAQAADFPIRRDWGAYTVEEHAVWRALFQRQREVLHRGWA
jgi:phenylalanine-4-hydroxylase